MATSVSWALPPVISAFDPDTDLLSGHADPNASVMIYVDGLPRPALATADSSGNWNFSIDTSLGEHYFVAKQIGPAESFGSAVYTGTVTFALPSLPTPPVIPTGPTLPTGPSQPANPDHLQVVGTSHLPAFANGHATDGVEFDVRVPFYVGSGDASKLVLSWLNWSPYSNSDKPSPYTVTQVAIEKDGGGWAPVTFDGGSRSKTIAAGASDVQTDAILPGAGTLDQTVFKQGDLYWIRFHGEVAAPTDNLPYMWDPIDQRESTGAGMWSYASGTMAQIDGSGAFTNVGPAAYSPDAPAPVVLGTFTAPAQSYFGIGDSILLGTGESVPADTLGTRGFFERAMQAAQQAYLIYAVSGITAGQIAGYDPWADYAKYTTTAVEESGVNDSGASAATIESRLESIWDTLRAAGVDKILRTDIPPSTSSTDYWSTAQDQSYRGSFGPGLTMDAVRQWLQAQVGQGIDAVVPLDAIRDPSDPWKYATDGQGYYLTADGGHPNTLANIMLADVLSMFL